MQRRRRDSNLYIDEAIYYKLIPNDDRKITILGAGLGIKYEKTELIDYCGIAYYPKSRKRPVNNKNGNGYWLLLGRQCLQLIVDECDKTKPEKIHVCNQIGFYVIQCLASDGLPTRKRKRLSKIMHPVTQRGTTNQNWIYRTKQEVGKLVRKKIKRDFDARIKTNPDITAEILEGKIYDIKNW